MSGLATLERPAGEAAAACGGVPLAFVRVDQARDGGRILANFARELKKSGRRIAGVIQNDRRRADRRWCDMFLENLATGEEIRISCDRGNEARGCRLDHAALAQAVDWMERAVGLSPELLVLNKFGKEEAVGRGFFPVMAQALASDIPVVVGVSALNLAAAQAMTGEFSTAIEPTQLAIEAWFRAVARARDG